MFRWTYLIPRLVILGLLCLAVWISSDPLIRYAIERSGAEAIGAKVQVGTVRTQLGSGKVYLKDVQIADPRNPMLNLLQADVAYVQLDPRQLLRREFVIEHGITSKVRFVAPRTESGALPGTPVVAPTQPSEMSAIPRNDVADLSRSWLDQIQSDSSTPSNDDLESAQLARALQVKWPGQFDQEREQVSALQLQIQNLREVIQSKNLSNPLRTGQIQEAVEEMKTLHERVLRLQNRLVQLQEEALSDRDALVAAKIRDQENAKRRIVTDRIDAHSISQLLLTNLQTQNVDEVLRWFRWFRSTIPDPEKDFRPTPKRGRDVAFQGAKPTPQLLIKSLEIDGAGHLAGQHLNFVGTVDNLSGQPRLHHEPISIHLRALGKQHLILDCILDRRGDVVLDTLNVQCPDLKIDFQMLGSHDTIAVAMGPTQMQAEIAIQMNGDELSGELVFVVSGALMHVEKVHPLAGGQDTADRLNEDLANINKFETYVQLSGTLEKPEFEFRSDLGNKFAATINKMEAERNLRDTVEYKKHVDQFVQQEIESLDVMIQKNLRDLAHILNGESEMIAELKQVVPSDSTGIRRIRY